MELDIMLQILDYHPRREEKIGPGIKYLSVTQTEAGRFLKQTRCFEIIRTDGSKEDFSYIKCLMAIFNKSKGRSLKSTGRYEPLVEEQGATKYEIQQALKSSVRGQVRTRPHIYILVFTLPKRSN
jgi:hypothetical protein